MAGTAPRHGRVNGFSIPKKSFADARVDLASLTIPRSGQYCQLFVTQTCQRKIPPATVFVPGVRHDDKTLV